MIHCQTTSVSAAHATHCATYWPRVGRSYVHFLDGFELHLLQSGGQGRELEGQGGLEGRDLALVHPEAQVQHHSQGPIPATLLFFFFVTLDPRVE